jgi:glycosyltransferase involved in cell wall biosynthesis
MKIAIAPHYFYPHTGGIEIVAQQHASRLADRGHDVVIVTSDAGANQQSTQRDGYRIERYRAVNPLERVGIPYPLPDPVDLKRVVTREVNEGDIDILHLHGMNYASTALVQAFSSDHIPVVLQQHTPFVEYGFPWSQIEYLNDRIVGQWNASQADKTICVSENIADYVHEITPKNDPEILYNGVDTSRYSPDQSSTRIKGIDSSQPMFFCLSRLLFKKGIDTILEAAQMLENRNVDVNILIAGSGPDEASIKKRANRLSNVIVLGYIDDESLPKYYSAATASLFTSKTGEAFPTLTILEALASGTPVIATKINEKAEGITDGHNGFLIPPGDETALANAIKRLATDKALSIEMGENARGVAVDEFDIENNIDRLETIYRNLS